MDSKEMKFRKNFVLFMIGHNRTGKSVLAKDIASSYKSKFKNKKKIIAYDPQDRFSDLRDERILSEDWEQYFDETGERLLIHDTLFILDDYRGLMMKDRLDDYFLKLLMLRNEHGIDFLFVVHSPKLIIERISYYITHFALFYVSGSDDNFKKSQKIQSVETVAQCSEMVNRYVREHGRGTYEEDKNFKFAWIDTEDEIVSFVNMDKLKIEDKKVTF
jgi:hypothetical protein